MEKTGEQIYKEFADQLCEWAETGKIPDAGNQDIQYILLLQKARLDKYHVKMDYDLKLRGESMDKISEAVFSDTKYTNRLIWRGCQKTVSYFLEGRKCLFSSTAEKLYTIVTWLNQAEVQETYCCPNCGTISEINTLMEGCPYCKTRFLMSDLFPKVTSYHFLTDYGMNDREAKTRISKWMITGIIIGLVLIVPSTVLNFIHNGRDGVSLVGRCLYCVLSFVTAGGLGALAGYAAGAMKFLFSLLKDGVRQAPMAAGIVNARKKLNEFLKTYDPSFSFEYFTGNIQSLLKILIFTDDRSNSAVYEGPSTDSLFDSIIDAQFGGTVTLNRYWMDGNYCHIDLNVYMMDVYCHNNRLSRKADIFQVDVCRNMLRPINYGFSIKKVCCKSCGASFDASKEKHCPYCKNSYDLKEDDWVITYVGKK